MTRRSILLSLAAVAAAGTAAVPIAAGGAQSAPRTFVVADSGSTKTFIDDVAPRTTKRGKISIGDRIVATHAVRIDGKAAGTLHSAATVTNRKAKTFAHFTAVIDLTLHLTNGDLYAVGFVDAAHGGDRYAIVGGTGAYDGARGSAVGTENSITVKLDT